MYSDMMLPSLKVSGWLEENGWSGSKMPDAHELIDAIPYQVIITHNKDKSYHVSTKIEDHQWVYKIDDSLENALALLWILLRRGQHV